MVVFVGDNSKRRRLMVVSLFITLLVKAVCRLIYLTPTAEEDEVTVEKLEFISDAKSVGFTIKEIGQIIDAWYNKKYTKKQKLEILNDKLISLEQKMKEIKEMKKQLLEFKDDVVKDRC